MQIIDFSENHIEQAWEFVKLACQKEQGNNRFLQDLDFTQTCEKKDELRFFAQEKLGFAAVEGDELLGFICAYPPYAHCYGLPAATGVWSPLHAHGFKNEDDAKLIKLLYQVAGEKWLKMSAKYHSITLFNHQKNLQAALNMYGFGCRCADSVLNCHNLPPNLQAFLPEGFKVCKIEMEHLIQLREALGLNSICALY